MPPEVSYRVRAKKPSVSAVLHDYSSTQVNIPPGRAADILRKMQASIQPSDLGPDGKESDLHITAKYGLHFQTPTKRLREALSTFGSVTATLGKTSLFKNKDADVLKVDVDSPDLHRLNRLISKLSPTNDTHPNYIPHLTLAYLKPGRGKKYEGESGLAGQKITFDVLVFSGKQGHIESIPLSPQGPTVYRVRPTR